ncbi:hypothetical protein H8959_010883 [Pygathrix nigripes]
MVSPNLHAMLTVVVEVESGRGSGPEDSSSPTLLVGPTNLRLLQPGTLETQEQSFTFDRVLGPDAAQLLQILFEKALPLSCSDPVLSTLSLVQFSPSGRTQDLLSSGVENLSVLDVAPLGLVVEDATEVEMSDSKAASELYLQATAGEGRACCLLTLIVSCPGPDPPEEPGTQGVWRGTLRILQLPGAPDCPLLRVLAGEVVGEEAEGSLPWIVSQLLEGNNYSGLLLRLDPQVEEARARRAGLRPLRLGLLEDTLTYSGLSQLGRALRELEVVKAWSQHPRRKMLQGARAEAMRLPEPQQVIESPVSQSPCLEGEPQVAGRTATLRCGLHQKNPLRHPKEQVIPHVPQE